MADIIGALPLRRRPYAVARFAMLGPRILEPISQALPRSGRILDVGSGIGLLSTYLLLVAPDRAVVGVEPNAAKARAAAQLGARLGLRHESLAGTVGTTPIDGPFAGIVASDVLHHVPKREQAELLRRLRDLLTDDGVLVMKDVTTRPLHKHAIAHLTDLVMAGPREPFSFRHHDAWAAMLRDVGLDPKVSHLRDPFYAHVLFVAKKR